MDSEYIYLEDTFTTRVIRVDTAVNAGNSGGGLYNGHGELIGIVNAKIVDESVENIGYAIPTSVAIAVADNIIDNCLGKSARSVKRAALGINLDAASSYTRLNEDGMLEIVESVVVTTAEYGSLAYGSLERGDILVSIAIGSDVCEITRTHHLIDFMLKARVGDTVEVTVIRGGETLVKSFKITSSDVSSYR